MSRWFKSALALSLLAALAGAGMHASAAPASGTACEKLTALTTSDMTVTSAALVPANGFTAPGQQKAMETPAFCRVQAIARPTSDSEIRFEVWLPDAAAWNGKFEGNGTGGFDGSIPYGALAAGLARGYAVTGTDTGHQGGDLKFGEGHPQKIIDWAWRAEHVTAEAGKLITRAAMGRWPQLSYFVGCSSGGHQALSEAQRFPADYDGIVAGDPGNDRLHEVAGYYWAWFASHDAAGKSLLSLAKLQAITHAAIAACDTDDGVKDGVIGDPRVCKFEPQDMACKGAESDQCLTPPQVEAVRKIYAGAKNPRTGEQIFPGWAKGSEGPGPVAAQSWGEYLTLAATPRRVEFYSQWLFSDPNWDFHTFDFDRDVAAADRIMPDIAAVDHDLTPFQKRGGKLVMTTGWSDPIVPPMDVIKYYEGVAAKMGGLDKIKSFYRFFMAPGMAHCGNGPGPNSFDSLTALEQWVEKGKAPTTLIASHITAGKTDRTRPLCPYPEQARWTGKGSTDEAANFVCKVVK